MPYKGHIKNGAVILDETIALPDGTVVIIDTEEPPGRRHHPEVERIIGILPQNLDVREAYREHLLEKHV